MEFNLAEPLPENHLEKNETKEKLLNLVKEGKSKHTKKKIEKLNEEQAEKLYLQHQNETMDKTNKAFTNTLIQQVSNVLENFEMIENKNELEKELNNLDLFKTDLKDMISHITPYIPYIGFITGLVCISSHIFKKWKNKNEEIKE